MLQLVAALVGAQSPATTGATRCCVADQEDMGGALAKIAGRPWGGRRRGGKGMACDVGVTRRKWPISISHAVRRNRHACARRMPEKQHASMSADSSGRGRLPRGLRHARRPAHDAVLKIVVRDLVLARADAPAH